MKIAVAKSCFHAAADRCPAAHVFDWTKRGQAHLLGNFYKLVGFIRTI